MKAVVTIDKSFDEGKQFSKEWEAKDFEEFFRDEGKYLDNLSFILNLKGEPKDSFTVTYTVTVTK